MGGAGRPVVMAAVAGAHGVTGEVRLKLFTASADNLKCHKGFEAGGRTLTLQSVRPGPQGAVARFAEVTDRAAAEALRGTLLTVPRESLPPAVPGETYWHDLVGLGVRDEEGRPVGQVCGVENFGASDILDIECEGGRRVLVPLVPAAVPLVGGDAIVVVRAYVEAG